jgi:hypothetical protein
MFLLQSPSNKGNTFVSPGDIVVDNEMRKVYVIAPDGSFRRQRDPKLVAAMKSHLLENKERVLARFPDLPKGAA